MRIVRTPRAIADIAAIWRHIAVDNEPAADRLLEKIDEKLRLLVDNPRLGRRYDALPDDWRSIPVGSYLLFYRPSTTRIELMRVLHGARDVGSAIRR